MAEKPIEENCMKKLIVIAVIAAFSLLPMSAQTVQEIVAKSVAARGGVEKIKALQSVRLTGHISFGPGGEGPFAVEMKRPGKMRNEITINGKVMIRTTDGKSGWALNGSESPRPLTVDELRNMSGGADFEGPLVDYAAKGNKVELVGKAKVEGRDAYKLRVTLQDGEVRNDYIDCVSYLEVKWEGKVGDTVFESFFRDYRELNGVMFAFVIDSGTPGAPDKQRIVFEKGEGNPALDDERFGRPALTAKDAK